MEKKYLNPRYGKRCILPQGEFELTALGSEGDTYFLKGRILQDESNWYFAEAKVSVKEVGIDPEYLSEEIMYSSTPITDLLQACASASIAVQPCNEVIAALDFWRQRKRRLTPKEVNDLLSILGVKDADIDAQERRVAFDSLSDYEKLHAVVFSDPVYPFDSGLIKFTSHGWTWARKWKVGPIPPGAMGQVLLPTHQ
jgi:hypothetical protein